MKKLFFIRHGEASHNIGYNKYGKSAYLDIIHTDSGLTEKGFLQAENVSKLLDRDFKKMYNSGDYCILVSPLKRCILTSLIALKNYKIPKDKYKVIESIREFPCGLHTCNKRANKNSLMYFFGEKLNFDDLSSKDDILWLYDREESEQELCDRIDETKRYINSLDCNNIIIFTHSSYMNKFLFNNFDREIEHCKLYEYTLK